MSTLAPPDSILLSASKRLQTLARLPYGVLFLAIPIAWLELIAFSAGAANDWTSILSRTMQVVLIVSVIAVAQPIRARGTRWQWSWRAAALVIAALLIASAWGLTANSLMAWLAIIFWFALMAILDASIRAMLIGRLTHQLARWLSRIGLCLIAGLVPVAVAQIESRFADEEFFAFAQAMALATFCFLLIVSSRLIVRRQTQSSGATVNVDGRWVLLGAFILLSLLAATTLSAYQSSFYSTDPPMYPGISAARPSLCGSVPQEPGRVTGQDVFSRLLARVAAHPQKTPAEFGMLALANRDRAMAEEFRRALLAEAASNLFTGPAGSVKWGQFEAALRAYYYPKVRDQFPGLFKPEEERFLRQWFAAINRRALTIEWVDWLYGLAFGQVLEGPYENQENGAGLLAILEANGLADPALSARNRAYLQNSARAWSQRFRNTDDAYFYQAHWLNNALFEAIYAPTSLSNEKRRQSFEWLLQQAMPDGLPTSYNIPEQTSAAAAYYLGAKLLQDPNYVWLAANSLQRVEERSEVFAAQPGLESAVDLEGIAPTTGSCLIYGDSGLPNQVGPLAPDKVVLRDGWSADSLYLLLNLRFSGWHRYKATNDIIALNQAGPLVVEQVEPTATWWLPRGRSALRDKRLPREDLNGLLIPAAGLQQVFSTLGMGTPWAQDPPHYARVLSFEPERTPQRVQTKIENWHGWSHVRTIYFYPQGPIIVVDSAHGGTGRAALSWHLVGQGRRDGNSLWLREGNHPARIVLPSEAWPDTIIRAESTAYGLGYSVVYYAPTDGRLDLVSVFLTGRWAGSSVTTSINFEPRLSPQLMTIRVSNGPETIELVHDTTPQPQIR